MRHAPRREDDTGHLPLQKARSLDEMSRSCIVARQNGKREGERCRRIPLRFTGAIGGASSLGKRQAFPYRAPRKSVAKPEGQGEIMGNSYEPSIVKPSSVARLPLRGRAASFDRGCSAASFPGSFAEQRRLSGRNVASKSAQSASQLLSGSVSGLRRSVTLMPRSGSATFRTDGIHP